MAMVLNFILARALDGTIGHRGKMPWHIPEDLRHFKQVTTGYPVIMGRRTYQSIGRPLPGRLNVVVSRRGFDPGSGVQVHPMPPLTKARPTDGVIIVGNEDAAVLAARGPDGHGEAFVIGGASLYTRFMEAYYPTRVYLTTVGLRPNGDTKWLYEFEPDEWERSDVREAESADGTPLLFEVLDRKVR